MTNTNRPISRLRRRLIEDMTARKLGAKTQSAYVRAVKQLANFLGRSPASASAPCAGSSCIWPRAGSAARRSMPR